MTLYTWDQIVQSAQQETTQVKKQNNQTTCPECHSNDVQICYCEQGDKLCNNCRLKWFKCKRCQEVTTSHYADGRHLKFPINCLSIKNVEMTYNWTSGAIFDREHITSYLMQPVAERHVSSVSHLTLFNPTFGDFGGQNGIVRHYHGGKFVSFVRNGSNDVPEAIVGLLAENRKEAEARARAEAAANRKEAEAAAGNASLQSTRSSIKCFSSYCPTW